MSQNKELVEYIDNHGLQLDAGNLTQAEKTLCYVMHNRLVYAINAENPGYKTMADLMREATTSVREMRDDIERLVRRNYNEVILMENVKFIDALEELGEIDLDGYQNCISYLEDLAYVSLITIRNIPEEDQHMKLVFNTFIYISVVALNLFNKVTSVSLYKEGVEVSFARKRTRAV